MFDRNLFYELCKAYDVDLDETAKAPAMKDRTGTHELTDMDVKQAFSFLYGKENC